MRLHGSLGMKLHGSLVMSIIMNTRMYSLWPVTSSYCQLGEGLPDRVGIDHYCVHSLGNYGKLGHGDNTTHKVPKLIAAFEGKVGHCSPLYYLF